MKITLALVAFLLLAIFAITLTGCKSIAKTGDIKDTHAQLDSSSKENTKDLNATTVAGVDEQVYRILVDNMQIDVIRSKPSTQPALTTINLHERYATTQSSSDVKEHVDGGDSIQSTGSDIKLGNMSTKHIENNFWERFPFILMALAAGCAFLYLPPPFRNVTAGIGAFAVAGLLLLAQGLLVWICLAAFVVIVVWPHIRTSKNLREVVDSVVAAKPTEEQKLIMSAVQNDSTKKIVKRTKGSL